MNILLESNWLAHLAQRIRNDIDRREQSREEWVMAILDLSAALAEVKSHFNDNTKRFGAWIDENQIVINKDECAAYVAFGQDLDRAREILGKTESRSIQRIYRNEFRVLGSTNSQKTKTTKEAPKTQAALDAYDIFKAAGIDPTREQVAAKAGVSEMPARRAIDKRKAEEAVALQGPGISELPKTAKEKAEAAVRKISKQMEFEFDQKLQAGIRKHITEFVLPMYEEKLALADRILATNKKPFTIEEYRKLLAALHPDSSSPEKRTEMFMLVKSRELLLRPPEKDKPLSGDLPKTVEELLARRRKR